MKPVVIDYELDARDIAIVRLVARGKTNAEIAHALGVGPDTVKKRLKAIGEWWGNGSRAYIAVEALRRGLVK